MVDFLNELEGEVQKIDSEMEKTEALARLEETMASYSGEDRLISSLEILEQIKTEPEELKINTGFSALDDLLGGFRENQLVVVAAPTKSGKTQFCIELTIRMEETKPVWVPFEESAKELIRKFYDRGQEPPLFYTPQNITGNTVDWIEKRVVEGKVKFGSKIFFIDHLHFIIPFSSDRLDTRIGQTMRDLKSIAKRNNVVIVLVAHLKKTRVDISPNLEDLRDSSFIAQEADTVLMLWRKTNRNDAGEIEVSNETTLSVQANRRTGRTGNITLGFNHKTGRFTQVDIDHADIF